MSQPTPAALADFLAKSLASPAAQPGGTSVMPSPMPTAGIMGMQKSGPPQPDRFILLAGAPFSGKTTACLSFPDPLLLSFDNKAPIADVDIIPFHDDAFVDSIQRRANPYNPANRKEAFKIWLENNILKCKGRTVILDSLTGLETAFHQQTFDVEKKWGVNGGLYFGDKLSYFQSCCALLSASGGRVIINAHLVPIYVRDAATGADVPTGKNKAALSGSMAEKIGAFCTSIIYAFVTPANSNMDGTLKFKWALRPCPAFDARTLATKIPPSGELDVTKPASAYEQFKACF